MKKTIAVLIVLTISLPLFSGQQKLRNEKENGQSIESYNYPEFNDKYTSERTAELYKICEEVEKETPQDIITYAITIVGLQPGGVAGKAGLRINDIIYSFNDRAFFDIESKDATQNFIDYVKSLPEGTYPMDIIRYGKAIRLQIKLPSYSGGGPRLGAVLLRLVNKPEAYFEKGISYLESMSSRDDLKKVSWLFETAKMLSPEWADVYYNLGLIYGKLDYYDEAEINLTMALNILKKNNSSLNEQGKIESLIADYNYKNLWLKNIKDRFISGKWSIIRREPELSGDYGELSNFIPKFYKDKNGKLLMKNLLAEWPKQQDRESESAKKLNISKNPGCSVDFDGRYFVIRFLYLWPGTAYDVPAWFATLYLFKGEIEMDTLSPLVKIKIFRTGRDPEGRPLFWRDDFGEAFEHYQELIDEIISEDDFVAEYKYSIK